MFDKKILFTIVIIIQSLVVFSGVNDSICNKNSTNTLLYKIVNIKKIKKFNIITIADTNNNVIKTPLVTKQSKSRCINIKKNNFYELSLINYYDRCDTGYYINKLIFNSSIPMIAGKQYLLKKYKNIFVTPNIQDLCYLKENKIKGKSIYIIKDIITLFFNSIYSKDKDTLSTLIDSTKMINSIYKYKKILKDFNCGNLSDLLFKTVMFENKIQVNDIKIVFLNTQNNIYTLKVIANQDKNKTYTNILSIMKENDCIKIVGIDLYYNIIL